MTAARIQKLRRKIRFRRGVHRWRHLLILLLIGLVAGAGYAGHWAYGKILNRQAFALVGRAMDDMREGNIQNARMGAETALRIKPGHAHATRLLARIQAASGQPEAALATFQKLTDERQLTLDDLKLYARLASHKGENQLATRLAKIAAQSGDPAFPHLLNANTLLRQKKTAEAEAELRAAVAVDQTDTSKVAFLDFLLSTRRPGQSHIEAATMIQEFSARDDALGAKALALGLRTDLMNPDKRGEWIEKLRAHPEADADQRLIADSAALADDPDTKAELSALPAFQNELAYHRILLGESADLDALARQIEENPTDLASRTTLAFHHLKNGNPKTAMVLFDSYPIDVDVRSLPPRLALVFISTLAANDKKDIARKIASRIPIRSVSRQEAVFFHDRLKPD
jgi:Tfp pilus assembly protein PilF